MAKKKQPKDFYFDLRNVDEITEPSSHKNIWKEICRHGEHVGKPRLFQTRGDFELIDHCISVNTLTKGTLDNYLLQFGAKSILTQTLFSFKNTKYPWHVITPAKVIGFIPLGYSNDKVYVAFQSNPRWVKALNYGATSVPTICSMSREDLDLLTIPTKKRPPVVSRPSATLA